METSLCQTTPTWLFISYKHEDVAVAEKVTSQFREIAEAKVDIVLSNYPDLNGAGFGGTLQDEIAKQLQVTEVFFFIYTGSDKYYPWCMYEAGLAAPRPESLKDTRVIVFSLVDQIPNVFDGKVVVKAKELDQLEQLFRDDFFYLARHGAFGRHQGQSDRGDSGCG